MGGIPTRSTTMKAALLLLTAVAGASANMESMMKEMLEGIDKYNFRTKCWGEANVDARVVALEQAKKTCEQTPNPLDRMAGFGQPRNPFFASSGMNNADMILRQLQRGGDISQLTSLWRSKRSASLEWGDEGFLKPDEDDLYEFFGQFADFKHGIASKMGNLTCVLKQMKMMTADNKINIDFYTTWLVDGGELGGFDFESAEGCAASQAEWRQKASEHFLQCHKVSQNWPQTSLNRNPLTRMFGRHMIFFKCADKVERKLCAEAQMLENLEKFYGKGSDEETAEYLNTLGLPEDKYDAAAISVAVMHHAATDEQRFVDKFMWGGAGDHM